MSRTCQLSMALVCAVSAAAQQVTDSAGIRVVNYSRGSAPLERWTLEMALEIGRGAAEGPQSFAEIMGVARLSDGRISVANRLPSEIRIFSEDGRFVRSLGRNGQGPGEFNPVLWRLLRSADTLIGIDNSGRAQLFGPSGDLVRSLQRPRPPEALSSPSRLAFDRAGNALVQALEPTTSPEATIHQIIWRESPDGARHERVLRFFAVEPVARRGPRPMIEVYGALGVVAANSDRMCAGVSNRFAFDCFGPNGQPTLFIRGTMERKEISEDDRRFFREAHIAANKGARPEVIRGIEESNRLTQFASHAPLFTRLVLATNGQLWVSEFDRSNNMLGPPPYRRPQRSLRWSVFDSDGRWRADVQTPARFMLFEAGADYVIGATLGEDDVDHVTLYRIRR
ncbi:MAG: 6-bladed beta-propeller [Gemmatimonadota bacterium]